jgi:hypothetical protein
MLLPSPQAGAGLIQDYQAFTFGGQTRFQIDFMADISPPSAFASNSLLGFIDIDSDRNPSTGGSAPWGSPLVGGNSWINYFIAPNPGTPSIPGPTIALGDEDFVDLGSEQGHPGLVDVVDTATDAIVATVPINYGPRSLSLTVPIAGVGGGPVNYGVLVGNFAGPLDRAPAGSQPATSVVAPVPEPAAPVLAGLGSLLAGLAGAFSRRPERSRDRNTHSAPQPGFRP